MGASGVTTVDFGAFPGSSHATVDVTGQSGLVSTSAVEAWLIPKATADHTADEHKVETIKVIGSYKVDGTLTIDAFNTSELTEPLAPVRRLDGPSSALAIPTLADERQRTLAGGVGTRLYGLWTVGWAWA